MCWYKESKLIDLIVHWYKFLDLYQRLLYLYQWIFSVGISQVFCCVIDAALFPQQHTFINASIYLLGWEIKGVAVGSNGLNSLNGCIYLVFRYPTLSVKSTINCKFYSRIPYTIHTFFITFSFIFSSNHNRKNELIDWIRLFNTHAYQNINKNTIKIQCHIKN